MREEIERILKMVEEGKLNSEQASLLIDALKTTGVEVEEIDEQEQKEASASFYR